MRTEYMVFGLLSLVIVSIMSLGKEQKMTGEPTMA